MLSVLSSHAELAQELEIIEEFPPNKEKNREIPVSVQILGSESIAESQAEMHHLEGIGTEQKHQQLQMEESDLAD